MLEQEGLEGGRSLDVEVLLEVGSGGGDDEPSGVHADVDGVGVGEHGLAGAPEDCGESLVPGEQLLLAV